MLCIHPTNAGYVCGREGMDKHEDNRYEYPDSHLFDDVTLLMRTDRVWIVLGTHVN